MYSRKRTHSIGRKSDWWNAGTYPTPPGFGRAWITDLFVDAWALSIPHNADYVILPDLRAFSELGVDPGIATVG